jgi:hypothetical protein
MVDGEVRMSGLSAATRQQITWCADVATCERLEVAALRSLLTRYQGATDETRVRVSQALEELPPSTRFRTVERILASAHDLIRGRMKYTAKRDHVRANHATLTQELDRRAQDELHAEPERLRYEIESEQRRVDLDNAELADNVLLGIGVVATVGVVAAGASADGGSSGDGQYEVEDAEPQICGARPPRGFSGCCSHHGGVNVRASRFQVMCRDGVESPSCTCW